MGRADEVQFLLECTAAWRSLGARITFETGWEGRGNGLSGNYEGGIWHHTAFLSSPANPFPARNTLLHGRPDLTGPLCNVACPWCADDDPWLHVIAAFPANHAGASGGASMGPLPVTSLFNPRVLGLEIDYGGVVPMATGQRKGGLIFGKGLSLVLGRSIEYVRAHAETSVTGKWDIGYAPGRTYDMAAFRRDAAAVQPGAPAAVPQEEPDMRIISAPNRGVAVVGPGVYAGLRNDEEVNNASGFLNLPVCSGNDRQFDVARSIALRMQGSSDVLAKLNDLAAQVAGIGTADVDEAALAGLLAPKLAGVTPAQIADALRAVLREGVGADATS